MKTLSNHSSIRAAVLSLGLLALPWAHSQNVELSSTTSTTTTTSEGTISEFNPQGLSVTTTTSSTPVRYISNETTNYVDETGNPVAATLVRSGLPVTIQYTKVGDMLVASRVMVRQKVTTSAPAVETIQTTTNTAGTISEFGPDRIVVRTESSPQPMRYTYSKTTTYVDETGAPVSMDVVKSGLPVTVYYTKVGGALVANKVIVRKTTVSPAPAPAAPVIEEKRTTTTTTKKNDDDDDD